MAQEITLFAPNDMPFGPLSDYARFPMTIGEERWPTVTNYIYGAAMSVATYRQTIKDAEPVNVRVLYQKLYTKVVADTSAKALDTATTIKFENPQLRELLMSTKEAPIDYISPNRLLGVGNDGTGYNLIGTYLMQTRRRIKWSFFEEQQEKSGQDRKISIYTAYLAESALRRAIREGSTLIEYSGKTPSDIIVHYEGLGNKLPRPSEKTVFELFEAGHLDPSIGASVENPGAILLSVRMMELRNLQHRQRRKLKQIAFDMYARYLLKKHFPDIPQDSYKLIIDEEFSPSRTPLSGDLKPLSVTLPNHQPDKAMREQFGNLSVKEKMDLEDRIWVLYKNNQLQEDLEASIAERIADVIIPTDAEVMEAESVNNILFETEQEPNTVPAYEEPRGDTIKIYPKPIEGIDATYNALAPYAYTGLLKIKGTQFPSITHYLITNLIALFPEFGTIEAAYPNILVNPNEPVTGPKSFLDPDELHKTFVQMKDRSFHDTMIRNARLALTEKFMDRYLQDLLLATGNNHIIWNDRDDPILGVGRDGKGENFIGKRLMELRQRFGKERKGDELAEITTDDITTFLKNNVFMNSWLQIRVIDTCRVINVLRNYLWVRNKKEEPLTADLVATALDTVYQPSSHVAVLSEHVTSTVPFYFLEMLETCPRMQESAILIARPIWNRIVVIIYTLVKNMSNTSVQNIKNTISSMQRLVSKSQPCVHIVEDQRTNCIVSALINVVSGLYQFNRRVSPNATIAAIDVRAAATIILGTDIHKDMSSTLSNRERKKWDKQKKDLIGIGDIEEDINIENPDINIQGHAEFDISPEYDIETEGEEEFGYGDVSDPESEDEGVEDEGEEEDDNAARIVLRELFVEDNIGIARENASGAENKSIANVIITNTLDDMWKTWKLKVKRNNPDLNHNQLTEIMTDILLTSSEGKILDPGFVPFRTELVRDVVKQNPNMRNVHIDALIRNRWRALRESSIDQRERYDLLAAEAGERYENIQTGFTNAVVKALQKETGTKIKDKEAVGRAFASMTRKIRTAQIPSSVKVNRINFFATFR
jgi:predicted NAD-dependent protein-ADP-ribosyltransferase YbiA (DUF1768 family)